MTKIYFKQQGKTINLNIIHSCGYKYQTLSSFVWNVLYNASVLHSTFLRANNIIFSDVVLLLHSSLWLCMNTFQHFLVRMCLLTLVTNLTLILASLMSSKVQHSGKMMFVFDETEFLTFYWSSGFVLHTLLLDGSTYPILFEGKCFNISLLWFHTQQWNVSQNRFSLIDVLGNFLPPWLLEHLLYCTRDRNRENETNFET